MKFKTLLLAFVLSISSIASFASTTTPIAVSGSFSNVLLGNISISGLSDVSGTIDYLNTASAGPFTFTLLPVSLSGGTFGSSSFSGNAFSFTNVASGIYSLYASGSTYGTGTAAFGSIYATYSVAAVPEPKTSGMFLAGLGIIGFIASRRKSLI
jgi:hypothetical protein